MRPRLALTACRRLTGLRMWGMPMEYIPAIHAAVVGMHYPARVTLFSHSKLVLDLDLTRLAPGRSPVLSAELYFDRTVAPERVRPLRPGDALSVVLIEVDPHPHFGYLVASLPVDPAWLTWNGETVRRLARHIRESGETHLLPMLADALEDAGCADAALLDHCRQPHEAGARSWAVELLATQQ